MPLPHISVCICTYRRPELLRRLIESVRPQRTAGEFTFEIVVCDNDAAGSAEALVRELANESAIRIIYCQEPKKNIALARNRVLTHAQGELVAFIDDDEFADDDWLSNLYKTCTREHVAGVLGPVRPHFEATPPPWIVRGGFCERPEHPTGREMKWTESRTGNFLFCRSILGEAAEPFNPKFGTGGEDMDFFRRMAAQGYTFVWCNEAIAYEWVPPSRLNYAYMLRRAMLRGRNILKHPLEDRPSIGTLVSSSAFVSPSTTRDDTRRKALFHEVLHQALRSQRETARHGWPEPGRRTRCLTSKSFLHDCRCQSRSDVFKA